MFYVCLGAKSYGYFFYLFICLFGLFSPCMRNGNAMRCDAMRAPPLPPHEPGSGLGLGSAQAQARARARAREHSLQFAVCSGNGNGRIERVALLACLPACLPAYSPQVLCMYIYRYPIQRRKQ